ncbi:MAG: hypothetical protein K6U14_04295 [Firmicutes bacterium]|nr:hypothetical protein [Alicyclobacillaceae bacterium]MCL6496841.1 hypothetical protein [Bacillota bacterium]
MNPTPRGAGPRERWLRWRARLRQGVAWVSLGGFATLLVLVLHHPVGTVRPSPPPPTSSLVPEDGGFFSSNSGGYDVGIPPASPPPMAMTHVS